MKTLAIDHQFQQIQESRGVSPRSGPHTGLRQPGSPGVHRTAFTLIELMISIALVLLLILGVNQVFTYTTQAVGAGEAVNAAIRSSRAAQAVFAGDFAGIVPNGTGQNDAASIIISSRAYYSYRNAKDQLAEGTISGSAPSALTSYPAAFLDLAGTGNFGDPTVNGDVVYPATYNFRNHRLDVLSFFSRGLFARQTGDPGLFVDSLSSQEAWIWYGHLNLPDNTGNIDLANTPSHTFPCIGPSSTNPNNYFGSQLVLGRMAVLLSPSIATIKDPNGNYEWYAGTGALTQPDPLTCATKDTEPGGLSDPPAASGITDYFPESRLDVANTSIAGFRTILNNFLTTDWWDEMMDGNAADQAVSGANTYTRFKCNPFVSKPMTSRSMAQASPYFLGGCSQFIVEFAGDFYTQDNDPSHTTRSSITPAHTKYGDITSQASDGQLDFTVVNVNGVPTKEIKWYGMPRSTSGNSTITPLNGDVVPVRDWLKWGTNPTTYAYPTTLTPNSTWTFEKTAPTYATDYSGSNMSVTDANTGYTCAFGPKDPAPKLIRITMTLEDPTGRLPEGQTYQYVFAVPQQ